MGRSVDYPSNAEFVVFMSFDYEDPDDASYEWDFFKEDVENVLRELFPNLDFPDNPEKWEGECRALLANGFGDFFLSEYCGLVSLAFKLDDDKVDPDYYNERNIRALGERWARGAFTKIAKFYGDSLYNKVGSFSNGEGVYERMAA